MAQRVLVTAGASGIGKEIARAFVAAGAKVCVCDIDGKKRWMRRRRKFPGS
jgi:NAD(P)-dependent dehydrogenase (short-subunit alcohol dehydrogenase family)